MQNFSGFTLTESDFSHHGQGLSRPECILTLADGGIIISNAQALVTHLPLEGPQRDFGSGAELSNTIALRDDGTLLVVDIARGAVLAAGPDGTVRLLYDSLDGTALGTPNFVMAADEPDVFYLSLSTRRKDFRQVLQSPIRDGEICRIDHNGIRSVAGGLEFPNAMQIDPQRDWFYVAETTTGGISRAPLKPNGTPGTFARFGDPLFEGAYTDGLALDDQGGVWVTEVSRNAIWYLSPEGEPQLVFQDPERRILKAPSDLAFGGPDNRRIYVTGLKMEQVVSFQAPVAGLLQRHQRLGTRLAG